MVTGYGNDPMTLEGRVLQLRYLDEREHQPQWGSWSASQAGQSEATLHSCTGTLNTLSRESAYTRLSPTASDGSRVVSGVIRSTNSSLR